MNRRSLARRLRAAERELAELRRREADDMDALDAATERDMQAWMTRAVRDPQQMELGL